MKCFQWVGGQVPVNKFYRAVFAAFFLLGLAACGGGSSDKAPSAGGEPEPVLDAVDDHGVMNEDGGTLLIDVLSNDQFEAGLDGLTILEGPANGSAHWDDGGTPDNLENGRVAYTPNNGFRGVDVFTYEIADSKGQKASATVTITVNAKSIESFSVAPGGNATNPKTLSFSWSATRKPDHYILQVNPDGISGYRNAGIGKISGEATGVDLEVALHLTQWERARFQLVLFDEFGQELERSSELTVADILVESMIGYFKAFNPDGCTGPCDGFGGSVALSSDGKTLAVGASGESSGDALDPDDNSVPAAGAVYIFQRGESGWYQQAYLKSDTPTAYENFGTRVALSGDGSLLAVGAPTAETGPGGIYFFVRRSTGWESLASMVLNPDEYPDLALGLSLAMSQDGKYVAAGSRPLKTVFMFTLDPNASEPIVDISNIEPNEGVAGYGYGSGVSLSAKGEMLAVAATAGENSAGAVYIFRRQENFWQEDSYIREPNPEQIDLFGSNVALSADGKTLAVAASGDSSGSSGIGGDPSDDSARDSGAVYVYGCDDAGEWLSQAYIKATNNRPEIWFGARISLSADGNVLAITAPWENSAATGVSSEPANDERLTIAGAAYVYVRENGVWRSHNYIKASNTGYENGFGSAIALSADGQIMAVGSYDEASSANEIGGDQEDRSSWGAGAVYVY